MSKLIRVIGRMNFNNPVRKALLHCLLKAKTINAIKSYHLAKKNIPYYTNLYKGSKLKKWEDIPIIDKHVLPDDPLFFLDKSKTPKYFNTTSGSSGISTPVFIDGKEGKSLASFLFLTPYITDLLNAQRNHPYAINALTYGCTKTGFSVDELLSSLGFCIARIGSARCSISPPKRIAETMVKLKPSLFACTPKDFLVVMTIIQTDYPNEYGRVVNNLKVLFSTAEPCAVSREKQIEREFGITHINLYASVDGLITIPCKCGEKHLHDTILKTEIATNDGDIAEYGTGHLIFTTLLKTPLTKMIRFNIGDLVSIHKSTCPYGYTKTIVPHGRSELAMEINEKIWGPIDFEEIIFNHGLFLGYNVKVYDKKINIIIEKYHIGSVVNTNGMKQEFEELTGIPTFIEVVPPGDLTNIRAIRIQKDILSVENIKSDAKEHEIVNL